MCIRDRYGTDNDSFAALGFVAPLQPNVPSQGRCAWLRRWDLRSNKSGFPRMGEIAVRFQRATFRFDGRNFEFSWKGDADEHLTATLGPDNVLHVRTNGTEQLHRFEEDFVHGFNMQSSSFRFHIVPLRGEEEYD
eukprot:TRINITY_DN10726_c0_g1_i1.p1 TRINITY_DN10726_c0_g1~~TRINITY_DN10726_c0_g1_i1.p1  ORF type:complete len:135 (+),score=7.24 TRINITY_DN10726_c0_g1_i1:39-443(+)